MFSSVSFFYPINIFINIYGLPIKRIFTFFLGSSHCGILKTYSCKFLSLFIFRYIIHIFWLPLLTAYTKEINEDYMN